jgi:8-oxo-dGTP pyrophosphatase MutT (NUDIX family)
MQRPIESAGVLPMYKEFVMLGMSMDDRLEYPGGKNENGEQAFQTANNEMIEEWGTRVVEDVNWTRRAFATRIPNKDKDIYLYSFVLNDAEYHRLFHASKALNTEPWPRDFSQLTGRAEPAKQTFKQIVAVPWSGVMEFVALFNKNAPSRDSPTFFAAVKQFCQDHTLDGYDIVTRNHVQARMRPFNLAALSFQ